MLQECFFSYYCARIAQMRAHLASAALYFDPDSVHNLRVEMKQLRAFFRLIECISPNFDAQKNLRQFRKLFKSAADLRDVHVQQDLTRAWARELPVFFSGYYNTLKQQERPARRKFAAFLYKFDLDREAARNTHSLEIALHDVGDAQAAVRIQDRIDDLFQQLLTYPQHETFQEKNLHPIRILAKELRYTIEIAQCSFPSFAYNDSWNNVLRPIHQALGKWHDAEIALAHVEDFYASLTAAPDVMLDSDLTLAVQIMKKICRAKRAHFQEFLNEWKHLLRCCQERGLPPAFPATETTPCENFPRDPA